jgi:hypothetical protein
MNDSIWTTIGQFFVGLAVGIYDAVSRKKNEPPAPVATPKNEPGWKGIAADEDAALAKKRAASASATPSTKP